MLIEKNCILCGRLLPIECFHKSSCNKDGHDNRCKECKSKLAHDRRDDATIEELKQIVKWMERVTTIPEGSTP